MKIETDDDLDKLDGKELAEFFRVDDTKKKIPKKWSDTYTLESQELSDMGTDETAGVNVAVAMCERVSRMSSFPTMEDFEAIDRLNHVQKSAMAAWKLGGIILKSPVVFKCLVLSPRSEATFVVIGQRRRNRRKEW